MDCARSLEESGRLIHTLLRTICLVLGSQLVDDDAVVRENDLWYRRLGKLLLRSHRVDLDELEFLWRVSRLFNELLCLPDAELRSLVIAAIDQSENGLASDALLCLPGLLALDRHRREVP